MKFQHILTDEAILQELGQRLCQRRIALSLSQSELSKRAGIGKRTLERMEAGASVQLTGFIRVMRVLELIPALEALLPETAPSPMDLLKLKGRERKRVSRSRKGSEQRDGWTWGDDT